jgi:hypothetical protein
VHTYTEQLVNAALLGTDKITPDYHFADASLAQRLTETGADREDVFLRQAAAAFLYEEAGRTTVSTPVEEQEFRGAIGKQAGGLLGQLLETAIRSDDTILLHYLISLAQQQNLVVAPHLVPDLLDIAAKQGTRKVFFASVAGPVGQWLCQFEPTWSRLISGDPEEDFDTASIAARVTHLENLRQQDPPAARRLLEENIAAETVDKRAALLSTLAIQLHPDDEAFLETQLKDKSKKIREIAHGLLIKIPGSRLSGLYKSYWQKAVKMSNSLDLIREEVPDEALFDAGMEKVSSQKSIPDYIFHLAQTIAALSPDDLAEHLKIQPDKLLRHFEKVIYPGFFRPYLTKSAIHFRHVDWAKMLLKKSDSDIDLIDVLPPSEQFEFYQKLNKNHFNTILHRLHQSETYELFPEDFAQFLLVSLRNSPYSTDARGYYRLGFHLPESVLNTINMYRQQMDEAKNPSERYFINALGEMSKAIEFRRQLSHSNHTQI